MKIENKTAVVTGANAGIGLATSEKLLDYRVGALAMVDISHQIHSTADEIKERTGNSSILAFDGDVINSDFREHVFATMTAEFGAVQICVPAAGIVRDGLAIKQDRETREISIYSEHHFRQILEVNLLHPTYWAMQTIAGVARHRQQQHRKKWSSEEPIQGSVVLIGSVSSRGNRGQVGYAASKSALKAVSSTLNLEGLFHGVQTRIIHPGFVDTAMVESIDTDYFEKSLKPLIGLGRKILPDEIGNIICAMIENPVISGEVWADASMTALV